MNGGNDVADMMIATYMYEMFADNLMLQKFDDSLRNLNESEKILKSLPPTAEIKKRLEELDICRQEIIKR